VAEEKFLVEEEKVSVGGEKKIVKQRRTLRYRRFPEDKKRIFVGRKLGEKIYS